MTSTPIINALRQAGYGFTHQSAISQRSTHIACASFVDDTDLWLSETLEAPPLSTLSKAQEMLDLWNGLLHSTGGALVARKSHWHWIAFQWTGKQWIYQAPHLPSTISQSSTTTQGSANLYFYYPPPKAVAP